MYNLNLKRKEKSMVLAALEFAINNGQFHFSRCETEYLRTLRTQIRDLRHKEKEDGRTYS